jgi:hypothetical protein
VRALADYGQFIDTVAPSLRKAESLGREQKSGAQSIWSVAARRRASSFGGYGAVDRRGVDGWSRASGSGGSLFLLEARAIGRDARTGHLGSLADALLTFRRSVILLILNPFAHRRAVIVGVLLASARASKSFAQRLNSPSAWATTGRTDQIPDDQGERGDVAHLRRHLSPSGACALRATTLRRSGVMLAARRFSPPFQPPRGRSFGTGLASGLTSPR